VEVLVYCRDRPGSEALLEELGEAHWSYMDRYADVMIARGPTLADGRHTGSLHIVDLHDLAAAHTFARDEPYSRAGVYSDVLVRRWTNELGRTMWEYNGDPAHNLRFLVLGHARPGATPACASLVDEHDRYFREHGYLERLIARGPLLSDDGREWLGTAMLVELPHRAAVDVMLASEPFASAGLYAEVEVHDWEFGGRR
jgi:uncharacterized protein